TSADCKQLRVTFYLERDAWGSSISDLVADNVKLTGRERKFKQLLGYVNDGVELEYFTYDLSGAYAPLPATLAASVDSLTIDGTKATATLMVTAANLPAGHDIALETSPGFTVNPAVIPAGTPSAEVTVTYDLTKQKHFGNLVLRCANSKKRVHLYGLGSPLPESDLAAAVALPVNNAGYEMTEANGFTPDVSKGYTIEFRARTNQADGALNPYFITRNGMGAKGYVEQSGIGVYGTYSNATKRGISNPTTASGSFYNDDNEFHTYRYAVTPDSRTIVYRDGIATDTIRLADLCAQPEWTDETGDYVENLLHNPGFEGEYDFKASNNIIAYIEGWNVSPFDQYNSTQDIKTDEISATQDQYNHTLHVDRYMWNAGWAAAEISQIVDVAPNEVYSFSALAKGGVKSDGDLFGSIRINEYPNTENKETLKITSDSWQTYATDYTTSADCKQLRVTFYLERDAWGSSISDLVADNVKLTGRERKFKQVVGYTNSDVELEYFKIDLTGAYAPLPATLETSVSELTIDGTQATATFDVTAANLPQGHDITIETSPGFSASPAVIPAGTATTTVTVTYLLTKQKHFGNIVLRCATSKARVKAYGLGSPLEAKEMDKTHTLPADVAQYELSEAKGFTPDLSKGYTIEARVRTNSGTAEFLPYFVTKNGMGAKAYVTQEGIGVYGTYNSTTKYGMANPANASGKFYNDDKEFHTYRYAVTPDSRAIVYRDGMTVDTLRLVDLCAQPEWTDETGDFKENLLHNPGFEGEYDFLKANNIIGRIEGWNVFPYDQYNSTQSIKYDEIGADQDQYNHTLHVDRYMWNAG
ncbi:MAG: carbohydrate binding domain-containing protein, partial [Bacteroidaceae bacterium]|nr:carbohydrate binding domain-containing protein [Bacteroidaceae bacterium]